MRIDIQSFLDDLQIMPVCNSKRLADVLALSLMQPDAELIDVAYECASAMGTVGISSLGTPTLNMPSKILILMTMYFGRVGPLSLAVLLASRQWKKKEHFRYPEDRVMIG